MVHWSLLVGEDLEVVGVAILLLWMNVAEGPVEGTRSVGNALEEVGTGFEWARERNAMGAAAREAVVRMEVGTTKLKAVGAAEGERCTVLLHQVVVAVVANTNTPVAVAARHIAAVHSSHHLFRTQAPVQEAAGHEDVHTPAATQADPNHPLPNSTRSSNTHSSKPSP